MKNCYDKPTVKSEAFAVEKAQAGTNVRTTIRSQDLTKMREWGQKHTLSQRGNEITWMEADAKGLTS